MRRRWPWIGAAAAVAAAALVLVLPAAARLGRSLASPAAAAERGGARRGAGPAGGGGDGGDGSDLPVAVVVQRDFVHVVPAEGNLRPARSTALTVPVSAAGPMRIAWLVPDGAQVRAGQVVVRFDGSEIERSLADALGDLEKARHQAGKQRSSDLADILKLEQDAAVARQELANAQRFQKKDATVYSRNDIIQSSMDEALAAEKERHAREVGMTRRQLEAADRALGAVDIRQAGETIRAARASLRALTIAAPHDGVLIYRRGNGDDLPHVGDQVWNGYALAEIPELAEMKAEVYVLEADAGELAPGRPATVVIESRPDLHYAARIARVDSLAKPRLRGSPVQYFAVILDLARTDPAVMKPGARVTATLRLAERRGALVVPRQSVFQLHGRNVVYRAPGNGAAGGFAAVPVELGPSDLGTTVILSGVAAGDRVALSRPSAS